MTDAPAPVESAALASPADGLGAPRHAMVRGTRLAFWHRGQGGLPLLLVHGWPATRRIWARNVAALAAAGFEVIAPDLGTQTAARTGCTTWSPTAWTWPRCCGTTSGWTGSSRPAETSAQR